MGAVVCLPEVVPLPFHPPDEEDAAQLRTPSCSTRALTSARTCHRQLLSTTSPPTWLIRSHLQEEVRATHVPRQPLLEKQGQCIPRREDRLLHRARAFDTPAQYAKKALVRINVHSQTTFNAFLENRNRRGEG